MGHNSIGDHGPSLPRLPGLPGGGRGDGADSTRSLLTLVQQGLSPGEAFGAVINGASNSSPSSDVGFRNQADGFTPSADASGATTDSSTVAETFSDLPRDVQAAVLRDADAIPLPIRNVLDQLGITQPQGRYDGPPAHSPSDSSLSRVADPFGAAREIASPVRADVASLSSGGAQSLGIQGQGAVAQTANAFAARDGANALPAGQTAVALARDSAIPQPGGRVDGQASIRAPEMGNVVVMADRSSAAQQQLQSQTLPAFAQTRADALPAQAAMATLAGAAMLANPQGNPVAAQAPIGAHTGAPPTLDAAAMQARDAQLAPAGHTAAGFFRRDRRKGAQAQRDRKSESMLAALLPGRRSRNAAQEEQATSTHWLYWILTIAAYGAIVAAIVAMIPSGGAVLNEEGRPNAAAYALALGALAAVTAWAVGKKLAKQSR